MRLILCGYSLEMERNDYDELAFKNLCLFFSSFLAAVSGARSPTLHNAPTAFLHGLEVECWRTRPNTRTYKKLPWELARSGLRLGPGAILSRSSFFLVLATANPWRATLTLHKGHTRSASIAYNQVNTCVSNIFETGSCCITACNTRRFAGKTRAEVLHPLE
ncbi:hypothetical protein CPC08DRAFT_308105 [Agrocybe pediades]|nr:hypothetical protein CPC08DRAFT_308105 [Agrocybe pediades]